MGHLDMDAFYASVEERERPPLAGHPLVIGGDPKGGEGRGVVATCNYAARTFGIRSGMPISQAYRACTWANFIRPQFELYRDASNQVMGYLREIVPVVEQVGLDECYLDLGALVEEDWARVHAAAKSIQAGIRRNFDLSCSLGIGPNRSVAKIASDERKPYGITVIQPEAVKGYLASLPVRRVPGIGPKMQAKLKQDDVWTVEDYLERPATDGKWDTELRRIMRGDDTRGVNPNRGLAKSRSQEHTFPVDESDLQVVEARLLEQLHRVIEVRHKDQRAIRTVGIKLRTKDWTTITRDHTLPVPLYAKEAMALLEDLLRGLLHANWPSLPIRLVGARISNFEDGGLVPLPTYDEREDT